jgi:hypothetical protein
VTGEREGEEEAKESNRSEASGLALNGLLCGGGQGTGRLRSGQVR